MSESLHPLVPEENIPVHAEERSVPQIRWVIVGYFFWVGIFLGAVIMHAATEF